MHASILISLTKQGQCQHTFCSLNTALLFIYLFILKWLILTLFSDIRYRWETTTRRVTTLSVYLPLVGRRGYLVWDLRVPFVPIPMGQFCAHEATKHNIIDSIVGEQALHFLCVFFLKYLENQSSTREKIAQLQHIQFLIEQQPVQRRELITKLTRHLVR